MTELKNALELFKLLEKSNCKKCGEQTCLAFAAAVFQGKRQLDECPVLDKEIIDTYGTGLGSHKSVDFRMEEAMKEIKQKISEIDLPTAAERTGGTYENGKLVIKVLGKNFDIFPDGSLASEIHINPWVTIPLLTYVLECKGTPATGEWLSFRNLKGGMAREGIYRRRCEKPLKKVADTYTNLFEDIIRIFQGRQVENHYQSDISLIIKPLPLAPILICYWKPDGGLDSDLNLFYDSSIDDNLNTDVLYTLVMGLVSMFEMMGQRHGLET